MSEPVLPAESVAEVEVLREAVCALLAATDALQPMTVEDARQIGWDALQWRYRRRET